MNEIKISNITPQEITIGQSGATGITTVYVNGVDVVIGNAAYVVVPTKTSELENDSGFITEETDPTIPYYIKQLSISDINRWNNKQDQLISSVNIKTINNQSILGSGNINIASSYTAGTGINISDENVITNTITSYDDLSDLPTIPTKVSDLENDRDYVTSNDLSNVAFTGNYENLTNKPTIPTVTSDLINDSGFITNNTDQLVYYYTKDFMYNLLPKVSGSGENINLANTYNSQLKLTLNATELSQAGTPTPSSPQDIHTISGSNKVAVCGKNLLSGVEQGTLDSSGQPTSSSTAIRSINFDEVKPSTTYTVSINGTATNINVAQYDSNKDFISFTFYAGTFTTSATTKYIKITKGGSLTDLFQVELGNTATTYTPYISQEADIDLGDIEYCKIGNYSDRIFKNVEGDPDYNDTDLEVGLWYIKKNIGKVVLDGSEVGWQKVATENYAKFTTYQAINNSVATNVQLCNYFHSGSGIGTLRVYNTNWTDFFYDDISLEDWKTWLNTNKPILYYACTPTYTQITGTLETQLEEIKNNILSYTGQTNISQINDDLPFTIAATTLKDISNL